MSLFSFVKEAGEKLLGLDDEEPAAPAVSETPEIKPAGANTSAATLHLMLSKYDLAPDDLGIGFVAAERQREGIVPDLGVAANLTLPFIDRFTRFGAVSRPRELDYAQSWVDRLGIRSAHLGQELRLLSGGNQQKVCLARWLVDGLEVLILEEPTRGVDLGARRELYLALRQWTAKGLAILLVSSDAEEVAGVCDRAIVLDRGRVSGRFAGGVSPADLLHVPSEKDSA
mgnify:CR=1 FL=1